MKNMDVAKGKNANQSSTFNDNSGNHGAKLSLLGNKEYTANKVQMTKIEENPWVLVSLDNIFNLSSIAICIFGFHN